MPIDRGVIDAQLREIGEGERWWEVREFRDLPHILHADERILSLVVGKLLGPRRPRLKPSGRWLIVATSHRLICLKQERFARQQVEIPADQILRIHHGGRFRTVQITIETALQRYRIRVPQADAVRFAGGVAALVPKAPTRALGPQVEVLSWIPGINSVAAMPAVAGIVSLLSPPDYASRDDVERLEATVERLQQDVDRLQQQVAFLEELLEKREERALTPG